MINRRFFPGYTLNHYDKNSSERGYWIWGFNHYWKVFTCSWLDREPVHFVSSAYSAVPGEVVRGYQRKDEGYKQHATACPEMGVHYNVEMPGVDISNMRANANFYSVQSVWACRKWWKKYFAWLYDTARLNAAICWQSVDKHRTHAQFVDELIDAYCWNRLDEGVSWKERRTGFLRFQWVLHVLHSLFGRNLLTALFKTKKYSLRFCKVSRSKLFVKLQRSVITNLSCILNAEHS